MKASSVSSSAARKPTSTRLELFKALDERRYDHAVICTYEFDANFFEEECLDSLKALPGNAKISILLDRGIYERLLSYQQGTFQQANLRYLLHPVSLSASGVFHPKIFLFVHEKHGSLFVGSANFTEFGLKRNAELVAHYRYEENKEEDHLLLFQQVFVFLQTLASRSSGEALQSHLAEIVEQVPWLTTATKAELRQAASSKATSSKAASTKATPSGSALPIRFLHNLDKPLWPQLCEGITGPVASLSILAPYYDSQPPPDPCHPKVCKLRIWKPIRSIH